MKIDTSDIPETGEDWFKRAKLVMPGADVIRLDRRRFVMPRRRPRAPGEPRLSDPSIQFVWGMMVCFFMWPITLVFVCWILGIRFVPVMVP